MTVLELLNDPSKWTQGVFSRDAAGKGLCWGHSDACCWCLSGAVIKCYPTDPETENVFKQLSDAAMQLYPLQAMHGLVSFNDHPSTTFEHIRKVVELANV